jgi:SAM-dependent methyltransferase
MTDANDMACGAACLPEPAVDADARVSGDENVARAAWSANATWWAARLRRSTGGDPMRRDIVDPWLQGILHQTSDGLLLDVGCGEGHGARMAANTGWASIGVDWAEPMIRTMMASRASTAADSRGRVSGIVADVEGTLPLRAGCVDLVLGIMSLMDVERLESCLIECSRVTRPGGRAAFVVLHPDYVERSPHAVYERSAPMPSFAPNAWKAWVRIAPDQPRPTLYVHRRAVAYADALSRAGWTDVHLHDLHAPASDAWGTDAGQAVALAISAIRGPHDRSVDPPPA